jgi:DNA-binding MarR family transcriptional regulator
MALRLIPAIHRATHPIGLYLERLDALGVTQGEAHVLSHLAEHGETTVGALHRAFAHRRSTLTSILDRLEQRGLVTRETSAHDRRAVVVRLTRQARTRAGAVHGALEALESRVLAGVPARRVDELLAILAAVTDAATSDE